MNRWNTNSKWEAASSSCRTRSARSPRLSDPIKRSSFSQITRVPSASRHPDHRIPATSSEAPTSTTHLSRFATVSRSQEALDAAPSFLVSTVTRRHWENDAVLSPRPNRPRSSVLRSSRGLRLPGLIASSSSSCVIPQPSSSTPIAGTWSCVSASSSIFRAPAVIELSTMSASAVRSE